MSDLGTVYLYAWGGLCLAAAIAYGERFLGFLSAGLNRTWDAWMHSARRIRTAVVDRKSNCVQR